MISTILVVGPAGDDFFDVVGQHQKNISLVGLGGKVVGPGPQI